MLIKSNDILNLKVITLDSGTEIGKVKDLIYDPSANKVTALLIDSGGWFSDAKVIPFESIKGIGKDAVTVSSANVIKKASEVSDKVSRMAKDDNYLTKTKVVTESGNKLGSISDVLFEETTGEVTELEVSQGLANLRGGAKRVKVSDIMTIGEDALIVKNSAEAEMEAQAKQGMEGTIYDAKNAADKQMQKAPEMANNLKQKGQSIIDKMDAKVSQMGQQISQKAQNINVPGKIGEAKGVLQDNRVKSAVGKYLTVNVLSPDDEVIAKRGDMITNEIVARADQLGLLDKVLGNTSESPVVF